LYYFIVLSCCLHSGILTIKRSKEKNAFMLHNNNNVWCRCYIIVVKMISVSNSL